MSSPFTGGSSAAALKGMNCTFAEKFLVSGKVEEVSERLDSREQEKRK